MQGWVVQDQDFSGNVQLTSQRRQTFYSYSLWRAKTGEHLFDGAAGDLVEALDSLHAHISYLTTAQRSARAPE